jgi:hypothetical protein
MLLYFTISPAKMETVLKKEKSYCILHLLNSSLTLSSKVCTYYGSFWYSITVNIIDLRVVRVGVRGHWAHKYCYYWLLVRSGFVQCIQCIAAILWCIAQPRLSSNHSQNILRGGRARCKSLGTSGLYHKIHVWGFLQKIPVLTWVLF